MNTDIPRTWALVLPILLFTLNSVQAQPRASLNRILFEPAPVPENNQSWSKEQSTVIAVQDADNIGLNQQTDIPDLRNSIELYLEKIAEQEQETTPFDISLFELHLGLGLQYQALEDHEAAITAFEKAEYISRINNGLYSPDQFPIIENMIDSYMATGDLASAIKRQQYLLYVNSQQYGDDSLEVVPVLTAIGDRNMATFMNALHAGNSVGFVFGSGGGSRIMTPRGMAILNLYQAQNQYYQAIINLVNQKHFVPEQLKALEMSLVEAIFLSANREGILEDPMFYMKSKPIRTGSRLRRNELNGNSMSFINGRNAWSRLRIYQKINPAATPLDRVQPILGLADWHRLFNRRKTANQLYQEARDYLVEQQVSQTTIDALLNPETPQQLPDFAPRPHDRKTLGVSPDMEPKWDGYMDVSFTLSRYGTVKNFEVTGKSANATRELERRLRRVVTHSPFRPRLRDIEEHTSSEVEIRYYFAQL